MPAGRGLADAGRRPDRDAGDGPDRRVRRGPDPDLGRGARRARRLPARPRRGDLARSHPAATAAGWPRSSRRIDWPAGEGYFWMAGESAQMRAIRRHLMRERRLPRTAYDVMGYWRASSGRQPRAVDPGPICRAGKAAGPQRRGDLGRLRRGALVTDEPAYRSRLRVVRRPPQRRQVDADQRAGRQQDRDHLRQAADHPDRGPRHRAPARRPADPGRHPGTAPAAHPARRAAQRPGPDDLGRGRRGRGLLPVRREGRPGRPVHRHRDGQGAAHHQGRGRHQDRPRHARADRRAPARHPAARRRRPASSGREIVPVSAVSGRPGAAARGPAGRAAARRARSSTPTATSPTRPRRSSSPS